MVEEVIPACEQYALQGEAFSRAVRGETTLEYGVEDAVANMAVIDAVFESEKVGGWISI